MAKRRVREDQPTEVIKQETKTMAVDSLDDDDVGMILEFDVDVSTVEKPEELPAGQYLASIEKAEKKTSNSENEYLALTIRIPPEQFPATYDAENAPEGVTLIYRRIGLAQNRRALYRLAQFCASIGVVAGKRIDLSEMVGKSVLVEVVHEKYEGEDRATIKSVKGA